MKIVCTHCSATVERSPSRVSKQPFCNIECRKAFHRTPVTCHSCGASFNRDPKTPSNRYCSWSCFKASRWKEVDCAECGERFAKRVCEIAKAEANGHKHMCSRDCRNTATSKLLGGDGTWVSGGKYGSSRTRGKTWPKAKANALARDNHECQQCGSLDDLEVHHWEPFSITLDNSIDNLVTLCRNCHQDKHQEYRREGFYDDVLRDASYQADIQRRLGLTVEEGALA